MSEKKEKKVLWFDETGYQFALDGLNGMKKDVEFLISAWRMQPVLRNQKFTDQHLQGILKDRDNYLRGRINAIIKSGYEKTAPGLSEQVKMSEPELKGVDVERLDRVCDSLRSWRPGSKSDKISVKMISIEKEKPVITDETLENLKKSFCVYDDSGQLSEFIQLGQIAESTLQSIQNLIDDKQRLREAISGYKMPTTLKMFVTPGQPGINGSEKGLFYKEIQTGLWKFNAQKIKR